MDPVDLKVQTLTPGNREQYAKIHTRLKSLLLLADEFKWLSDAYLSDFFSLDLWCMLKPSWRILLDNLDLCEIALLLKPAQDAVGVTREVWPLSLLAFRASSHALSLSRVPCESASVICDLKETEVADHCYSEINNVKKGATGEKDNVDLDSNEIKDGQYMKLQHCYRRHVKPKKQHEILVLGKAINQLCELCHTSHVIDVGAGQGHLCRLLSFGYGLNVTTIEAAGCHAPKAQKFDQEVLRDISRGQHISKKKKKIMQQKGMPLDTTIIENAPEPSHVVARIDSDISVGHFLVHVHSAQHDQVRDLEDHSSCHHVEHLESKQIPAIDHTDAPVFALTGLHACGDLTPTMLRVFVKCPQAVSLASVGCCYMKMDMHLKDRGDRDLGYPMSEFVRRQGFSSLSWEAREMACHFMEAYNQRLLEAIKNPHSEAMAHLRTHCYRAALQEIISLKNPKADHGSIKLTLKKAHLLPFNEYSVKALTRLGLDPTLTEEMVEKAETRLKDWKKVVAFYTLRLSLAPVFESIILLDRMIYLAENGISSSLVPLFDPSISPRNFVLLAAK